MRRAGFSVVECMVAVAVLGLGTAILVGMIDWTVNYSAQTGDLDRLALELEPKALALAQRGGTQESEGDWTVELAWTFPTGIWFYRVRSADGRSSRWQGPFYLEGDQ